MISGAEDEDGDGDDGAEEDDDAEPRRERTFVPVHTEEKRPSSLSATLITDSFESRHRVVVEVEVVGDGWGVTESSFIQSGELDSVSGSRRRARV